MIWILFIIALPWTLTISWPWVLIMCAIRAAGQMQFRRLGVLTAVWRPWAKKHWKYSTTLGRGIIYQPGFRSNRGAKPTKVEVHEFIHVRQVEDCMMLSFVLGLIVFFVTWNWLLGLIIWWSGGLFQAPNFLTAGIRNGFTLDGVYRGSEHERAAFAQATRWCDGHSWWESSWKK